jgi:lipopolysaccharide transport system permease protein
MKNENMTVVEIKSDSGWFDLNLKEIWQYRDLLWLFVRRDIVTVYKQTILGPLWYIVQPLLTTLMFTMVFGRIAKLSTDGIPPAIFYLLGVTLWGYFSESLNRTSNTFVANQHIFGKVYFPRVTVPGSIVISNLLRFGIQLGIFFIFWAYYFSKGQVTINEVALLLPLVIVIMAVMSRGFGMIFSAMTTKYRDLQFLLAFAVQLWMYATPIIYPLSTIPEKYLVYLKFNPVTPLIETMRYGFLGQGTFSVDALLYSSLVAVVTFFIGLIVFSRVEKSFMDTV